jgi:hypothetical protein
MGPRMSKARFTAALFEGHKGVTAGSAPGARRSEADGVAAMSFRCATCGEEHDGLPDLGMEAPDPYLDVPDEERAVRTTFTPDRCVVRDEDGEHYFVRGVILIPVHARAEPFGIGAWVSQSRENFERYAANAQMGPTFGWLVNRLAHYEETTFLLKTRAHFRSGDQRPTIELEPTDHPLAVEQRRGITIVRAWEIVHKYMPN